MLQYHLFKRLAEEQHLERTRAAEHARLVTEIRAARVAAPAPRISLRQRLSGLLFDLAFRLDPNIGSHG